MENPLKVLIQAGSGCAENGEKKRDFPHEMFDRKITTRFDIRFSTMLKNLLESCQLFMELILELRSRITAAIFSSFLRSSSTFRVDDMTVE